MRVDRFQRLGDPSPTSLDDGVIAIGALEIAQLANNPNFPERGRLALGGRRRQMSDAGARPQAACAAARRRARECCGCCDGIAAETPQGIDNRGGLSAIAYRIGDYAQFRASLHAALSSSDLPRALRALRTRDDDDFTIGLIDAFACAADVLTFYQERIANESYLRTAAERVSLQELGKLIGYRLRPAWRPRPGSPSRSRRRPRRRPTSAARAGQFRHRRAGAA